MAYGVSAWLLTETGGLQPSATTSGWHARWTETGQFAAAECLPTRIANVSIRPADLPRPDAHARRYVRADCSVVASTGSRARVRGPLGCRSRFRPVAATSGQPACLRFSARPSSSARSGCGSDPVIAAIFLTAIGLIDQRACCWVCWFALGSASGLFIPKRRCLRESYCRVSGLVESRIHVWRIAQGLALKKGLRLVALLSTRSGPAGACVASPGPPILLLISLR